MSIYPDPMEPLWDKDAGELATEAWLFDELTKDNEFDDFDDEFGHSDELDEFADELKDFEDIDDEDLDADLRGILEDTDLDDDYLRDDDF